MKDPKAIARAKFAQHQNELSTILEELLTIAVQSTQTVDMDAFLRSAQQFNIRVRFLTESLEDSATFR